MIFKDYKIKDLFSVETTNTYGAAAKDDEIINDEGHTPYISNTIYNNGLIGYSLLPANNTGNSITVSDTVTSVYETFYYQKKDFIGKSHVIVLRPIQFENEEGELENKFELTEKNALYMITCMKKSVKTGEFDYGTKFNREEIKNTTIKLPVKSMEDDLPDFDYMEEFITETIPKYFNKLDADIEEMRKRKDQHKNNLSQVMNEIL